MKNKKEPKSPSSQKSADSSQSEKVQEYLNGWKRALADYENLKRDLSKQKEEDRQRIKIDFAYQLLPVIDNFEQAVHYAPASSSQDSVASKEIQQWLQGIIFIQKQFEDVMNSLGIERIEIGSEFNPELHESVGEGEEFKEVNSGWKMGEKIIRPVKVIIKQEAKSE
jgi:molecular chaperone GrpE